MFSFVSRLFRKRKAVEEASISSGNSPKRLRHVEEKPMSNNNAPQIKYDVFVSFRGEIRNGFLSHLIDAFERNQINAFVDDRLEKGKEVGPSLVGAIEGSSISLIIFSENYASSRWCLEEVVTILKCRDEYGQIVIPVFYKVEPTHVGHQSSESYKKAFDEYQRKNEINVQIWRDALKKTAKISGIVSSNWDDAQLVKEIIRLVLKKLVKPAVNSKRLVGIDEKIATLESLIKEEPKDTRIIGIWGMGGLGKTTLAEHVFNKLRREYGGSYFLVNERDQSSKRDLISLKKEIFSQLLGRDVNIDLPNSLPTDVLQGIGCIKVLIVLDDMNDSHHIRNLLGDLKDFGLGSRIIITTRNEQVLKTVVHVTYQLPELNLDEALELFNLNAFNKSDDQREYNKLLERVVRYAQGIPLVLEVLAGHLRGNTKEVWEGELDKLGKMPHRQVYDVMIRSYDDLDREQQQSFLDIACFFLRSQYKVNVGDLKFLLKDGESDNSVVSNLERLKEKALITFSKDNFVSMHDVLQETALEIARRKSIECPGSYSWLWDPDDINKALKNDKVSEAIRSFHIRLPANKKEQKLIPQIFAKMSRLQFLDIFGVDSFHQRRTLAEGLQFLSTEIRFLGFNRYPLKSLPENFPTEKLVVLTLQFSSMEKLWDDVKNLVNLKTLNLNSSKMLKELPDLSKAINLEVLLLCRCSMLTSVHPSIFSLPKLEKLDLNHCSSLTRLATDSHLCKLKYLDLSSCKNLTKFSVISENMKELRLDWTKVKALPSLFEHRSKLELLNLCGTDIEKIPPSINNLLQQLRVQITCCEKLQTLPEHLPYGETLDVSGCTSLQTLPKLRPSLKTLIASYCESLPILPELPLSLKTLITNNCKLLKTLPELPPTIETLDVRCCYSLENLPKLPPSLKIINAQSCKLLKTLPELPPTIETLDVCYCHSLETLPMLPPSLKTIDAQSCKLLKTLPVLPPSIETLNVNYCWALVTLPELPTSLETLHVIGCRALETLPELPPSFETLNVNFCLALVTLPELPTSLKTLDVTGCEALETLPKLPTSLETLDITGCRALETLPELPPSIETLNVNFCWALVTLPELPTSLGTLDVTGCRALETLPELPPSIETLNVNFCSALVSLPELPTSLKTIDVTGCWTLETLPQLPTSLETLDVSGCRALETLPELPLSLKTLTVCYCKSLQSLRELPLSIETLMANYCESLKTVSFPSTTVEQLKENRKRVLFWNCLNLDEHSLVSIVLNAQINMMKFAHRHLSSPNHDHVENHPDRAIYMYPGSSVPEWLENKTTKDYIIIDLSSAPASPPWGFIFCLVFGQYQDAKFIRALEFNLILSDEDEEGKMDSVRMYIDDMYGIIIDSNHVCVMYDQRCSSILNSRAKNQMKFKIQLEIYDETAALPQEVLKGFGVSLISSWACSNFIQQMELGDRDSKYQIH